MSETAAILQHFRYKNRPAYCHEVGAAFYSMADELDKTLPRCAEKSTALRKLLEARDCAFRALDERNRHA